MMDAITRKVLERLCENTYLDEPMQYYLERDGQDGRKEMYEMGCLHIPLFCESNRDNDGAYKLMTERYLLKYLCAGNGFERSEGRLYLNPYPAADADDLLYTFVVLKDRLRPENKRPWPYIRAERFLVRTVGSVRESDDGELYYDDSPDSRFDWVLEQAYRAYVADFSDPLDLPDDGYLWRALFERAVQSANPVMWTFWLRHLRGVYKLRIVLTLKGMSMRGDKEGRAKFKEVLERAADFREWLSEAREEIRGRGNDACGFGKAEGVEAAVIGA